MVEPLRELLTNRISDLQQRITDLYDQLRPLEAELSDAKKALNAIVSSSGDLNFSPPTAQLHIGASSPYASLTMKQLALKALSEHFPNGATASQLLQFFKDAYGRADIVRSSLSPQLTRLKTDGLVERARLVWRRVPPDPDSPIGFLNR